MDTNVLVHAHRELSTEEHERSLSWLRTLAEGRVPWGLPVFCIGEFVRVTTHPKILDPPSTLAEALDAMDALMASPSVRVLDPDRNFSRHYRQCVEIADARGNLAFDAQIAAVCRQEGVSKLLTYDRDFDRFADLEVVSPKDTPSAT